MIFYIDAPGPGISEKSAQVKLDFAVATVLINQKSLNWSNDCSDWLKFQRRVGYAEMIFYRIGPWISLFNLLRLIFKNLHII